MNYSRQREVILQTLKSNVVHPTAEYLYSILKEKEPNISLATLYRNLNQLSCSGVIKKIDGLENSSHYDHNIQEHYHFICDECKRVFDVSFDVAPDIVHKTEEKTGFIVKKHDIIFNGICKECLEKIKESN